VIQVRVDDVLVGLAELAGEAPVAFHQPVQHAHLELAPQDGLRIRLARGDTGEQAVEGGARIAFAFGALLAVRAPEKPRPIVVPGHE
jgi:hypothetical protein